MAQPANTQKFEDTQEAAFRKVVRDVIRHRRANLTKGERDVTLSLVNQWFHHRNGPDGFVHPGRRKLARIAGVSVRTVASCLKMLRDAGVIEPIKYAKGGCRATRYTIDLGSLFALCGCDIPEAANGNLALIVACKIARFEKSKLHSKSVQKLHTDNKYACDCPSQGIGNVIPFRGVAK